MCDFVSNTRLVKVNNWIEFSMCNLWEIEIEWQQFEIWVYKGSGFVLSEVLIDFLLI